MSLWDQLTFSSTTNVRSRSVSNSTSSTSSSSSSSRRSRSSSSKSSRSSKITSQGSSGSSSTGSTGWDESMRDDSFTSASTAGQAHSTLAVFRSVLAQY